MLLVFCCDGSLGAALATWAARLCKDDGQIRLRYESRIKALIALQSQLHSCHICDCQEQSQRYDSHRTRYTQKCLEIV